VKIGVLGGGPLGLAAAYRLAQNGHEVVVVERDTVVGGLASAFEVGGTWLEKYYHHIFRTDTVIARLIDEVGLGPKLYWGRPKTSNLTGGVPLQLDSPLSVLRFSPLPFPDRVRLGMGAAYLKFLTDYRRLEETTAAEWIRRWMGERAYEVVWQPLLSSKFGDYYDQIAAPWFWSRVHLRTSSLGYLHGGFHQLFIRLVERIRDMGGQLALGEEVQRIAGLADGRVSVTATARDGQHEMTFDSVIVALPTRLFIKMAPELPEAYRAKFDWGDHYGAHSVILALDRQLLADNTYWLSVTDPGYPFLAAVEHTNFVDASHYGGLRLLYLGNYLPMSDPRFRQSGEEVVASYLPHLTKLNRAFDESWVKQSYIFKAPFAQPIVTKEFRHHIPPLWTPIRNVFLANMFQVYPQDRGQNYSIKLGEEVARLAQRVGSWPDPETAATWARETRS
jgi:protoporphyrinogen oxidase